MKLGLCGNISLSPLATGLDLAMPGSDIIVGRTGDYKNELAHPFGEFASLDACVVALDWRDIAPSLYDFSFGDDATAAIADFRAACNGLKDAIEKYRTINSAKLLVFSPVSDSYPSSGFINRLLQPSPFELFGECQNIFNELCRSLADVYPVDMEAVSSRIGKDNAFDPSSRIVNQQPFSSAMIQAIVGHVAAMCVQFKKYPLKCLVLDCDNTLWGGIVGEAGPENLVLGDTGPGKAYKTFQEEIVKLHKQGVILAICSKNNTCDALEVMEQHPHMLIRPSMISCYRINWDDKPKNMLQISAELNIGLDAMMFADDTPSEREMMRATLPDVEVLELPDDPSSFADTLKKCTRFWPLQLTKDDTAKSVFFSQERLRRETKELAENVENYLINSKISITIAKADAPSLPRITQLFNKTNQFNLTTKRYSGSDLEKLARNPDNHLFYMSMKDAYGDYGIIATALIAGATVDSFVLSCRAFGKRAENAFLIYLLQYQKDLGRTQVFGRYIPSQKNAMTKDFYQDLGFVLEKQEGNDSLWRFDLDKELPKTPRWITVITITSSAHASV